MGVQGNTVLVTGGAGFIGSHLVEVLAESNTVRVLDRDQLEASNPRSGAATVYKGDIRNQKLLEEASKDVDVIFHEAAQVSVENSVANPKDSHSVNVGGTLNVLERAREINSRVVLASSAAIYGTPQSIPIDESHPKNPESPYGLDKLSVDEYSRLYHELYGLETVALRYFNVYGPRQSGGQYSGVIDVFLDQALNDDPITVHGDGSQTRDFVNVKDVVRANQLAASSENVGEAYNIGSGSSISISDLATLIRDIAGSQSEIIHTDPRDGDINQSMADLSRARDELGFDPTVSLREGLDRLVNIER